MRGFIEVTDINDKKHLINVRNIEEVVGSTIYLAFQPKDKYEQDCIECEESYRCIKAQISEATSFKG